MKSVVILQSNYLPWKGYFDLIHDADLFVFHDDLQYTKNDWRNRNRIKTPNGSDWLTIPVGTSEHRLICEVRIADDAWQKKHWNALRQAYATAPHFEAHRAFFEDFYLRRRWTSLSELNQYLVKEISQRFLGMTREFMDSRELALTGRKQERVIELLKKVGATKYISGPAAKDYLEEERFAHEGIELVWKDYGGYPEYPQRHPPFEHGVAIVDLLFNLGPEAPWHIWGWRGAAAGT